MKKQPFILAGAGFVLVALLFVFGKTTNSSKIVKPSVENTQVNTPILFNDLLVKAKSRLNKQQLDSAKLFETRLSGTKSTKDSAEVLYQLASFWKNSGRIYEPYVFYLAKAAKLENSEKNLTFAARQFLDNLMVEGDPAMQNWLATNAKDLLEQALTLNPSNDSTKIGLGACYILGGISNNPMQGILPVKAIADKNPNNTYAQLVLALGGKKSGQFDKAIERFLIIVQNEPKNLEVQLHLAECYELKGDNANAIKWYSKVKKYIPNEAAQKELESRIGMLQQKN